METATGPTSATDARKPSVRVDTPRLGFFRVAVVAFDTSAMVDGRLTRTTGLDATPRLGLRTRLGQTHRWRNLAILWVYRQMPTPTCWHRATDSCITQISARSISHRQYVNAGIRPPQTTNKQPCILVSIIYRVQPRLCCRFLCMSVIHKNVFDEHLSYSEP